MTEPEAVEATEHQSDAVAQDLRCTNPDCTLRGLKLESDEVAPEPGSAPDRCAGCGGELTPQPSDQP